jgi:heptosyltransferase-1
VEESYRELLNFHPDINKVHEVNIKNAKKKTSVFLLLNELRRIRKLGPYDLVIDMQGLIKSAIISRFLPSKLTLGFDKSSARESLASIFYNKTFKLDYNKNVVERNFELIKFALKLPYNKEEIHHKLAFLHSTQQHLTPSLSNIKKNIILIPGASFSSKCYPVEKFAELTNLLDANYLIVWGSDEEKLLADKIKKLAPHVNICEKLSIEDLISLVSKTNLVIGPDTGPTHMGWASNIPSITLFGPTPGYRNTFITENNKVIESKSEVNPYKINKNDHSINEISAKEVVKMAQKLLDM